MKENKSIPVSKVARATKVVSTGLKVGGNYVKHYSKKLVKSGVTRDELDEKNAETIYNSLSELKGSALKMAQMMSMDTQTLPPAFAAKFQMAQYSAPPLSGPLVKKTLKAALGDAPENVFDTFNIQATHAASIGQVHEATLDGKKLAVKVQYPGVGESVKSDLKLVKPFALKYLKLKERDVRKYLEEVEAKLLEETDYEQELEQGVRIAEACAHIPNLLFPTYYPELSSEKVITMDWMQGKHLSEIEKLDSEQRNKLGQALWDFYNHQIFALREIHADPHPGNFLVTEDFQLVALDFGCVKKLPEEFFTPYFSMTNPEVLNNDLKFTKNLIDLEIINENDAPETLEFFKKSFHRLLSLLTKPYHTETFDFGDEEFFKEAYELGEQLSKEAEENKMLSARGSKHFIYVNRTFFGLYSLLNKLGAEVRTNNLTKGVV